MLQIATTNLLLSHISCGPMIFFLCKYIHLPQICDALTKYTEGAMMGGGQFRTAEAHKKKSIMTHRINHTNNNDKQNVNLFQ